jgi:Zn finger protein HypA/HybF involved in hydrogenase expression
MNDQRTPKSLQGIESEDKERKCPECGSKNLVMQGHELICKDCGLIIE